MAIEKVPATKAPWPPVGGLDGGPINPYPLTGNPRESFYTIADDLTKKGIRISPIDLVKLNFRTTNLAEVNWYLREYVGCTKTTADGQNYTFAGLVFSEANKTKAVIFVPRPKIVLDEIDVRKPASPDEESLLNAGQEFEFSLFERKFANANIQGKFSLTIKGKFAVLKSSGSLSSTISPDKAGGAIAKKISDNISVQAGYKLKKEDFEKGKPFLQTLREGLEAAVNFDVWKSGSKDSKITVSPGLKASSTPFVIKLSGQTQEKFDIGDILAPGKGESLPVIAAFTIQVAIEVGPSPSLLRTLGPGALIAGIFIGFIGFGAYMAGRASDRGRKTALASWYVNSYLLACGFRQSGMPATGIDEQNMQRAGREDCERDIKRMFPNHSSRDALFLWVTLWIVAAGHQPGTREAFDAGGRKLEEKLWADLRAKFDVQ
jgi:hypothetical protein